MPRFCTVIKHPTVLVIQCHIVQARFPKVTSPPPGVLRVAPSQNRGASLSHQALWLSSFCSTKRIAQVLGAPVTVTAQVWHKNASSASKPFRRYLQRLCHDPTEEEGMQERTGSGAGFQGGGGWYSNAAFVFPRWSLLTEFRPLEAELAERVENRWRNFNCEITSVNKACDSAER